jgi:hypothetical protein
MAQITHEHLGAAYGAYAAEDVFVAPEEKAPAGARDALTLAGTWTVVLDPQRIGEEQQWMRHPLTGTFVHLPGTLDEAGLGDPNAETTLHHLHRPLVYIGPAWYEREIDIPDTWAQQRVVLALERVMWESRVWIDGCLVGSVDSLCTPHRYDVSAQMTPGRHRLTIRIDNSERPGANVHGYGTDQQIKWNGILGNLQVSVMPRVYLDDLQAYPDVANHRLRLVATIGNVTRQSVTGTVHFYLWRLPDTDDVVQVSGQFLADDAGARVDMWLPLADPITCWDEFSPQCYMLQATVETAYGHDTVARVIGLRELGHDGTQLTVNGHRVFLRGTHDGGGFPLTGYPPCDVESWRRIFRICRQYGLNHVRYHSFCPPEAAFVAADDLGIYLQIELPFWGTVAPEWAGAAFLQRELDRILREYGHHPSFVFMSLGNEHDGDWTLLDTMVDRAKRADDRHLYAAASNQYLRLVTDPLPMGIHDDFAVVMWGKQRPGEERPRFRYMERFVVWGESVAFDQDYCELLDGFTVPTLSHEPGQWWIYPDFSELIKYTGVLQPANLAILYDQVRAHGLLPKTHAYHQASGRLAMLLYKEDIERVLRTPRAGGFQLLDLHDYSGQGTSLVGLLDAFWESKGLVHPEEFCRYCAPTVILARFPQWQYQSGDVLEVAVEVAHYGAADLNAITPYWQLRDQDGGCRAAGELTTCTAIRGETTSLGTINITLQRSSPAQLALEVTIPGVTQNQWSLWVYPREVPNLAGERVREVTCLDDETLAYLESGGRVLLHADQHAAAIPIYFQTPMWNPFHPNGSETCGLLIDAQHPALAEFPTTFHADWQWFDLLQHARGLVMNEAPPNLYPLVEVIDQPLRSYTIGAVMACAVGQGRLVISTLCLRDDAPLSLAARQLRHSILAYLATAHTDVALPVTPEELRRVLDPRRFRAVAEMPDLAHAVLDVSPSADAPLVIMAPWQPTFDHVSTQSSGFAYAVVRETDTPANTSPDIAYRHEAACGWLCAGAKLQITCPPGFAGTVFLHFQDQDRGGQRAGYCYGFGTAWMLGRHDGPGCWIAVEITPVDTTEGLVELVLDKLSYGYVCDTAPCLRRVVVLRKAEV